MDVTVLRVELDTDKLNAVFAGLDHTDRPGVAVGIAVDGVPRYRKGFGLANCELPTLLSPSIRMRINSTSKQFTALAYLLLCEDGLTTLDRPIGDIVPELHPVIHRVTGRQLMGNTSGIRDAVNIFFQFSGPGPHVTTEELLALYRTIDDLEFQPGTGWRYCNGGFELLGYLVERIAGSRLEDFLRGRIFAPIGMWDTLLRRFDNDFLAMSAVEHCPRVGGGYQKSFPGLATSGMGGIVSTIDDMLRWLRHMDEPRIGTAETWALMRTPQLLANGTSTGYGGGLILGEYRGLGTVSHAGAGMGSNAQMLKVPGLGLDIMVIANSWDIRADTVANQLVDVLLGEDGSAENGPAPEIADAIYQSPATGRVIQFRAAPLDRAFIKAQGQFVSIDGADMPVLPADDGRLRPVGAYAFLNQHIELIGNPASPAEVVLDDYGTRDVMERVGPASARSGPEAVIASYASLPTKTRAAVRAGREGLELHTEGRFGTAGMQLEHLAGDIYRARSANGMWGGILTFSPSGFKFSNWRTCQLPFVRGAASPAAAAR